jgi:hypothetical protein
MRKPPSSKGQREPSDVTPPGGRALERVRQDRLARGLGDLPKSGSLVLDDDTRTKPSVPKTRPSTTRRVTRRAGR